MLACDKTLPGGKSSQGGTFLYFKNQRLRGCWAILWKDFSEHNAELLYSRTNMQPCNPGDLLHLHGQETTNRSNVPEQVNGVKCFIGTKRAGQSSLCIVRVHDFLPLVSLPRPCPAQLSSPISRVPMRHGVQSDHVDAMNDICVNHLRGNVLSGLSR